MSAITIMSMPDEILLKNIFKDLSPKELVWTSLSCGRFYAIASTASLWNAFPLAATLKDLLNCIFIDENVWNEYADMQALGLSFEGLEALDHRATVLEVGGLRTALGKNTGLTLLTIPEKLSLDILEQFGLGPKKGSPTGFKRKIKAPAFNSRFATRAYRVLITNSILPNSRNQYPSVLETLAQPFGCRSPSALEAATLLFMKFIRPESGVRLLGDRPKTFTHTCDEAIHLYVKVGDFSEEGVAVDSNLYNWKEVGTLAARILSQDSQAPPMAEVPSSSCIIL